MRHQKVINTLLRISLAVALILNVVPPIRADLTATLSASTYFGLDHNDGAQPRAAGTDAEGNTFVVVDTEFEDIRADFPDAIVIGGSGHVRDIVVAKISGDAKTVLWVAVIGNAQTECVHVGNDGSIYIAGFSYPSLLPLTNPFQPGFNGNEDAVLVRLGPDGDVRFVSFFGGREYEFIESIYTVGDKLYVAGQSSSPDLPGLVGPPPANTGNTPFISELSIEGTTVHYSRFIQAPGFQKAIAAAGNSNGDVTFVIETQSTGAPTTPDAFDSTFNGPSDLYIGKIDRDGTLLYGTYFGGSGSEIVNFKHGFALDNTGNLYFSANSTSNDLPVINGSQSGGAYLFKMSPNGQFIYSTRMGGTFYSVGVDNLGRAVVAGESSNAEFRIYSPTGGLELSTLFGGSNSDVPLGVGFDSSGGVVIAGETVSTDFPTTLGAFRSQPSSSFGLRFNITETASPIATNQVIQPLMNSALAVTLPATDADTPAQNLTYTILTQPQHGTLTGTGANRTYTPNPNYFGNDQFTFKANDGLSDSNVGIVSIYVIGTITTYAGNGQQGNSGNNGSATQASLNQPNGIYGDKNGNIYLTDSGNNSVRRVDGTSGMITAVAGGDPFGQILNFPIGISIENTGNILVVDFYHTRVVRIDKVTHAITLVAGNGQKTFSGDDGPATEASFWNPNSVSTDASGNIYISDGENKRIRRVDAISDIITTVAGNGNWGSSGDHGPATLANLSDPRGVFVDRFGNIYIADIEGLRIRRVDGSTGIITTVAGNGSWGFSGDGGLATEAKLRSPIGVWVDGEDNIYFTDLSNSRIRRVDKATGIITTIAGGASLGLGDNGPATAARLQGPSELYMDALGNIFVADFMDHRIRRIGGLATPQSDVPNVNAGPDQTVSLSQLVTLAPTITPDLSAVRGVWSLVSGPGPVVFFTNDTRHLFGNATISNPIPGEYILKLTIDIGTGIFKSDTMKVTVVGPGLAPLAPSKNMFNLSKGEQAEINVQLAQAGSVDVEIYDRFGRKTVELHQDFTAGNQTVFWRGIDSDGEQVAAGVYHALINAAGIKSKLDLIVIK